VNFHSVSLKYLLPLQRLGFPSIAFALLAVAISTSTPVQATSPDLVISQIYGGGGNTGATYKNDYVEIFNRSTSAVSLSGKSIQYASATGTGNFASNPLATLSGSLSSGQYYLVQLASSGAIGANLPTPDATGTANMSASGGKVALVNSTTGLACNGGSTPCSPSQLALIIDLIGYDGANFYEGSGPAPTLSATTAAFRANGGCQDTDVNSADFSAATPSPRNSSSAFHYCTGPTNPTVAGAATPSTVFAGGSSLLKATVTPGNFPPSTGLAVTGNLSSIGGLANQSFYDNGTNGDVTPGDNIFSFQATVSISTTTGSKSLSLTVTDAQSRSGSGSISLTVQPPLIAIHDIQGATHISPKNGQFVSTQGIVTAKRSNGFYLQDPNPDSDPATSEGIFVFTSSAPSVNVGDKVTVVGTVSEFRSGGSTSTNLTTTELTSPVITLLSAGNALPAPIVIGSGGRMPPTTIIENDAVGDVESSGIFDLSSDGIDFYESLEGMRVQLNNAVAVGPWHNFGSNREIPVVGDNGANASLRTYRGGIVIQSADYNPERIILNDLITGGPTLPVANVGDKFPGAIVGFIDYSFGNFKLQVASMPALSSGGLAREAATLPPAYQLAAGTFNVENLAPSDPPSKFSTLAGLIVNNLKSPDLLAIEEIQDNNGVTDNGVVDASTTWGTLITAIQTAGGPTYVYRQINPVNDQDGGAPGGNIRQGFLFRTDRGLAFVDRAGGTSTNSTGVTGSGASTQLTYSPGRIDPANSAFNDSRKPLAGEFTFKGDKVFVIANHFNSKGGDDPLFGRHQPPIFSSETQRQQQSQIVHNFVQSLVTANPNANVIVLGDLNDFQFSTSVSLLKGSLLNDLIDTLTADRRYSYDFEGNSEVLDHILLGNSTFNRPRTYQVVHVNSEFWDQASDHEPQVANVCVDATPPTLSIKLSPNSLWPANHKYVTVNATVTATDNADPAPKWTLVSAASNEPDDGLGDGDTPNDIVTVNSTTFSLRAERSGNGNGRTYTITYRATDACGNSTQSSATVKVPKSQGQ
jgi:predicted extracellular nuclease